MKSHGRLRPLILEFEIGLWVPIRHILSKFMIFLIYVAHLSMTSDSTQTD